MFKISYGGLAGYLKIEEIHFTQLRRRMLKIKPSIRNNLDFTDEEPIKLIIDASGLTISKKGSLHREENCGYKRKKRSLLSN